MSVKTFVGACSWGSTRTDLVAELDERLRESEGKRTETGTETTDCIEYTLFRLSILWFQKLLDIFSRPPKRVPGH